MSLGLEKAARPAETNRLIGLTRVRAGACGCVRAYWGPRGCARTFEDGEDEIYFTQILHNFAVFGLQRAFFQHGLPFFVLPVRV